jgi:hypothetical protein
MNPTITPQKFTMFREDGDGCLIFLCAGLAFMFTFLMTTITLAYLSEVLQLNYWLQLLGIAFIFYTSVYVLFWVMDKFTATVEFQVDEKGAVLNVTRATKRMLAKETVYKWEQLQDFRLFHTPKSKHYLYITWCNEYGIEYHFFGGDYLKFYHFLKQHFPDREPQHWYD